MKYPSEIQMLASIFEAHKRESNLDYTRTGNDEKELFVNNETNIMFDEFLRGYEFHREMYPSEDVKCH